MEIISRVGKIPYEDRRVYSFLSNFNNFKSLVPADKLKNWTSDEDHCHFSVAGMGETGLRIIEREAFKLIKITTETGNTLDFLMWLQIKHVAENDSRIKITVRAEINAIMSSVISGPLKTFADSLIEKMESFEFPEEKG